MPDLERARHSVAVRSAVRISDSEKFNKPGSWESFGNVVKKIRIQRVTLRGHEYIYVYMRMYVCICVLCVLCVVCTICMYVCMLLRVSLQLRCWTVISSFSAVEFGRNLDSWRIKIQVLFDRPSVHGTPQVRRRGCFPHFPHTYLSLSGYAIVHSRSPVPHAPKPASVSIQCRRCLWSALSRLWILGLSHRLIAHTAQKKMAKWLYHGHYAAFWYSVSSPPSSALVLPTE